MWKRAPLSLTGLCVVAAVILGACELFNPLSYLQSEAGTPGEGGLAADSGGDGGAEACANPCGCYGAVETLTTKQDDPRALIVDESTIYWVNTGAGTVSSLPKNGGDGAPQTLVSGLVASRTLAADPVALYVTSDANGDCTFGVLRVPKNDPDAGVRIVQCTDVVRNITGVAVDGVNVYWTNPTYDHGVGAVYSAPKGAPGSITAIAPVATMPAFITANASSVFWIETSNVLRAPKGEDAGVLVPDVTAGVLAADDTTLFYTTSTAILSIASDGTQTTGTPIAQNLNGPNALALDAQCVFFTTAGDGAIWGLPRSAGAIAMQLAGGQSAPSSIASDSTGVYWANGSGEIRRMARQPR